MHLLVSLINCMYLINALNTENIKLIYLSSLNVLDTGQSNSVLYPESCFVVEIDLWFVFSFTVTFISSLELRRALTYNSNTQTLRYTSTSFHMMKNWD